MRQATIRWLRYWEVIYTEDVEQIFGKRAWVSRSEEILELQEKANGKKAEEAKVAEADKQ